MSANDWISGDEKSWAVPQSCPAARALARPSSSRQGSSVMRQDLILASGEGRGTHSALSKSEGRSGLAKGDSRERRRVLALGRGETETSEAARVVGVGSWGKG